MKNIRNQLRLFAMRRSQRYKEIFTADDGNLSHSGEAVLADLRNFCKADKPTIFHENPQIMARNEGRREVFQRIVNMLALNEAQVKQIMENDDGY